MKSKLYVLEDVFTIHRFPPDNEIPVWLFDGPFCHITKTVDEISVICSASVQLNSTKSETGWSCIKVLGPLDLNLTGLLADVLKVLAKVNISIIALSTYDTDYILVKSEKINNAIQALRQAEYSFEQ